MLAFVLLLFVLSALTLADMKGHFTRRVLFDPREAAHNEAAVNILAYQEQGSDLNPQCYLFWIGNYLHSAITLIDLISDIMYMATVPKYHTAIAVLLPITLVIPFIALAILAWMYARTVRETRKER